MSKRSDIDNWWEDWRQRGWEMPTGALGHIPIILAASPTGRRAMSGPAILRTLCECRGLPFIHLNLRQPHRGKRCQRIVSGTGGQFVRRYLNSL